ncbi:hypothetical protein ES692_03900 [Psychroserpens burtonensis]|uniref:Uncharacterized protein n=1 Tax=Psychroserpens burtonensis TaxID=49278 RepID=A0A5C7BAC6_9FLAO|nr:hypothetical protein [Psychroserpens burtonensis]TXE19434.1 hypothetical protein ES692_03900 [Psychroserpens burtonensis]
MKQQNHFTLKELQLNNNCPECYSNKGLELTFKQRFVENAFYKAITEERINEMHCNTCNTDIYPARWTNEIERVVAYQKRAIQPRLKSLKLKKLSWILITSAILLTIVMLLVLSIL